MYHFLRVLSTLARKLDVVHNNTVTSKSPNPIVCLQGLDFHLAVVDMSSLKLAMEAIIELALTPKSESALLLNEMAVSAGVAGGCIRSFLTLRSSFSGSRCTGCRASLQSLLITAASEERLNERPCAAACGLGCL